MEWRRQLGYFASPARGSARYLLDPLIPFATGWTGENHFTSLPTAIYGVALLMPAIAWFILQRAIH